MQYFTIQAKTNMEAIEKMRLQYGASARVLTQKSLKTGGLLGFFRQDAVEITGYISQERQAKPQIKVEDEKRKILDNVKQQQSLELILKEIQALKSNLPAHKESDEELHPAIKKVKELLILNDFSYEFIEEMLDRIRREFSLEDLNKIALIQKAVIDWIGEKIQIYPVKDILKSKPRIIVVVGPTGVGKTTTIAKLAAIYGLGKIGNGCHQQVRMVTIDNYKIAAKKQIEIYADIMQIPASYAETRNDLEKIINMYQDHNVLLIDTIGKSPNDYDKLAEMRSIVGACGVLSEVHLAISATTKLSDIEEIIHQFEPFKFKAIIVTKLDETTRIGNLVSALAKHKKSISYITDGQMVPQDIAPASIARLLMCLEGFRIEREWIERKFGLKDADIMK
jgi:flagellar biosynthesis protein FlhF